jgi:predicted enzyme related to lactoylglutathione lyase
MALQMATVCVDARDPSRLGRFWARVLGWESGRDDDGDVWVRQPRRPTASRADGPPRLLFMADPGDKVGKNRLHLDFVPDDYGAELARLESLGATRADVGQVGDEPWTVLADPEGNEFCLLEPDD